MQCLLPLFEDWTYSSLPQLPSVRSTGTRVEPVRPQSSGVVPQHRTTFQWSHLAKSHVHRSSTFLNPAGGSSSIVSPLTCVIRTSNNSVCERKSVGCLTNCVSERGAVGVDGVLCSLFKVPFPYVLNQVLSWAWFPVCGNAASWCTSSNGATPVSPPTIALFLSRRAAWDSSRIWSMSALDRASLPNSTSAKADSDGVLMFWSVHSSTSCLHEDPLSLSSFLRTCRKRSTPRGSRVPWFGSV